MLLHKKKILIIGDSNALPRPEIFYEKTWPALLKTHCLEYDVILSARRRNNSENLRSGGSETSWAYGDTLHFYRPDIVVIQQGISECFPRYLKTSSLLNKIIERSPSWVQTCFWKIYKQFFKRSVKRADVLFPDFCRNIRAYLDECIKDRVTQVMIVLIHTQPKWLQEKIPALQPAVDLYNQAYLDIAKDYPFVVIIPFLQDEDTDKYFLSDGVHYTSEGNRMLFEAIREQLLQNSSVE